MTRKILAITGLALACVGIGLFVGLGTWVWYFKTQVDKQAAALAARAEAAGDAADHAIAFVRDVMKQAKDDLKVVREQAKHQAAMPVNPIMRLTARQASQQLAGSVERAQGAVVAASDAVAIAEAALTVVDQDQFSGVKSFFGVNPDQIHATRSALGSVAGELRQAKSILGIPIGEGTLTNEQLNAVDGALAQAEHFTDAMAKIVTTARSRVRDIKAEAELWMWRTAAVTSLLCAWGAFGQIFLANYCWRKLRRHKVRIPAEG